MRRLVVVLLAALMATGSAHAAAPAPEAPLFRGLARTLLPTSDEAFYDARTKVKRVWKPSREKRPGFDNGWEAEYQDDQAPFAIGDLTVYVYDDAPSAAAAYRDACDACKPRKRRAGIKLKAARLDQRVDGVTARCAAVISLRANVYVAAVTCGSAEDGYTFKKAEFEASFLVGFLHGRAMKLMLSRAR